ncbi:MAG: hypothetical protein AAFQ80_17415 [Cyanobacteria bacterium J06621_8]
MSDYKTYQLDGDRPIENAVMEVADTFEDDGTRPIAKSPDFLIRDTENIESESTSLSSLDNAKAIEKADQRPKKYSRVVDTFEDDGERPIMSNKYQIVGTLNIDGERPITSK